MQLTTALCSATVRLKLLTEGRTVLVWAVQLTWVLLTYVTVQATPSIDTSTSATTLPNPVPFMLMLVVVLGLMYLTLNAVTLGVVSEEY